MLGDKLGRVAHLPLLKRAPQAVLLQSIGELAAAVAQALAKAGYEVRRPRHALHSSGDEDIGFAGDYGVRGHHNGFQARTTYFVDRRRPDRIRKPASESGLPGRRLTGAGRNHQSHQHLVYRRRIDP